jgi:hypothetical protein
MSDQNAKDVDPVEIMREHRDHIAPAGVCVTMPIHFSWEACLVYLLAEALANGLPEWERAKLQGEAAEERARRERAEAELAEVQEERDWLKSGGEYL